MDPALDNTNNGAYPSLPPNAPSSMMPQSPNTLAMSLLNNLMQIQGLENSIVQQQLTNPSSGASTTMPSSTPNSQSFNSSSTSNPTLLLEQQIKLSQLQQLQQLQNQIFQQQIALISGQSPSILPSSPTQQTSPGDYTGLPTPGPSGEIRPQRLPMDFLSPSAMSSFMEPLPRAHIPQSPPSSSSASSSHPQDQMNSSSSSSSHNQHSPDPNMMHHLNLNPSSSSSNTHTHTRQGSGGGTLSLQRQLQALSTSQQSLYAQQQQSPSSYLHHQHHQTTTSFPQSQRQSSSGTPASTSTLASPVYHPVSPMQHPVSPMLYGISGMPSPNPNVGICSTSNSKMNMNQGSNMNLFGSQAQHSHRPSSSSASTQQQPQNNSSAHVRGHSSISITGPHSAPESLAFQIYTGPFPGGGANGGGIPGLTLGPAGVPLDSINMSSGGVPGRKMSLSSSPRHAQGQGYTAMNNHHNHTHGHNQGQAPHMQVQMQILDQDISPLTSPWLGAHPTGSSSGSGSSAGSKSAVHRSSGSISHSNPNGGAGSKRTASGSGDEGGSARKKQSPAIRPTLQMSIIHPTPGGPSSGRYDRDRESGSTSPLTLGAGAKSGNTPPPKEGDSRSISGGGGEGGDGAATGRNKRSSQSASGTASGSASGSASPDPERDSAATKPSRRSSTSKDNSVTAGGRRPYRGSKSTNSTPLLKSTLTTGSGMSSTGVVSMTPMMKAMNAKAVSRSRSKSRSGGVMGSGGFGMLSAGGDPVHDSPSPVDLNHGGDDSLDSRSMPPPPLPASVSSGGGSGGGGGNGHMNLEMDMNMNMGVGRMMDVGEGSREREGMSRMGFGTMMSDLGDGMNMNMSNEMGMSMGMQMGMGGDMNGDMGMGGMHAMGGMHNMGGMGMDMGGMNGMNMDMDMSLGMGGMDMNAFGGMGGLDMSGMDFGQLPQTDQQQQGQGQGRGDHHPSAANSSSNQLPQNEPNQQEPSQQQHPLVPVTPASIMNLGRLGINSAPGSSARLGSASASASALASSTGAVPGPGASSSASSTRQTKAKKDTAAAAVTTTTRSGRISTRRSAAASGGGSGGVGNTVNLKPLLPAGTMTPNLDATLPSPMSPSVSGTSRTIPMHSALSGSSAGGAGSGSAGLTVHVRKTSHKAAEQKRRDSLKTTFDDLRKLLPPIALPNDADADPNTITSPLFHATTPLLPGALPPRGPPKAGGEGPNKGVSKLQLLICGNEYIRLLKGRVDRRDEEIEKLRREVGRLRLVAEGDESAADLDLEKDLDSVEKNAMMSRNGGGAAVNDGGGEDMMDEGDDEGDE